MERLEKMAHSEQMVRLGLTERLALKAHLEQMVRLGLTERLALKAHLEQRVRLALRAHLERIAPTKWRLTPRLGTLSSTLISQSFV
jgi:hypothetical protein